MSEMETATKESGICKYVPTVINVIKMLIILRIIHRPNEDKVGAAESNEGEDNSKDEHVNNQSTGKSFWASGSMSLCSSSSIVSLFLLTTGLMLIF